MCKFVSLLAILWRKLHSKMSFFFLIVQPLKIYVTIDFSFWICICLVFYNCHTCWLCMYLIEIYYTQIVPMCIHLCIYCSINFSICFYKKLYFVYKNHLNIKNKNIRYLIETILHWDRRKTCNKLLGNHYLQEKLFILKTCIALEVRTILVMTI